MATWQSANMSAFLPPELSALTDFASTTAGAASTVLGAIKAAADLAKNFLTDFPPFDYLQGLDEAVDTFRDEFLNFGMYSSLMWDYPLVQLFRSGSGGEDFDRFVDDLANSFFDTSDPNVPPFSTSAAMLVLVGGFGGVPGALELLKATANAFSWWEELNESVSALQKKSDDEQLRTVEEAIFGGEIKFDTNPSVQTEQGLGFKEARKNARELLSSDAVASLNKPTATSTPAEVLAFIQAVNAQIASSNYPDWQSLSLRTMVPPLVEVVDLAFDPIVQTLAAGRGALDNATALIDNLAQKIAVLDDVVSRITEYLDQLDELLSLTGLYALFISTSGGVTDLANQLRAASNPPFEGVKGFYFGAAFVTGGVGITPFTNLFGPIGGS